MESPLVREANGRVADAPLASLFLERWSPRSFVPAPAGDVPREHLQAIFEAARWAHSCFNAQPWLFVYGASAPHHESVLGTLVEANRVWAARAPVLGIVFARRAFEHNGKPNRWSAYDAGSAAMSASLQAQLLGYAIHWMGGFDADAAHAALRVPAAEWEAMAAFALGRPGPREALPEGLREREQPSTRKPLSAVLHEGPLAQSATGGHS